MGQLEVAGLQAERLRLAELSKTRDLAAFEREYDSFAATNPRRLAELATTPEARRELRALIESWDALVHGWVLDEDAPDALLHSLMIPNERGSFELRHLTLLAFWLAEVGSHRLGMSALPVSLGALPLAEQARALGRFCTRNDGRTAIDYSAVHDALRPELRPFLAHWTLTVYLISPTASVDDAVRRQRSVVCADFARCHASRDLGLEVDPLYLQAGYRAIYHSADPHDFVSVLSERILAPHIAPGVARAQRAILDARRSVEAERRRLTKRRRSNSSKSAGSSKSREPKGLGVLLSCFGEDHAVRRCTEPLLAELRDEGAWRAYFPEGHREIAMRKLGERWAGEHARIVAADAMRLDAAQAFAGRIAADNLDFLFFPEVGISTASTVLATQRLARVQAATYGHPATSGSPALDYFVSGLDLEDGTARYRERLVLLPGLGVASNLPPDPTEARRRPLSGEACCFASLSSIDKLNSELLQAWRGVLETSRARVELHHFPGARGGTALAIESAVRTALGNSTNYRLHQALPRSLLLQQLQEADVVLDSFPFSGFNTLVDALSLSLPVVTLRRPGLAGGLGAAVMTRLDCAAECVATTSAEFVAKAARLAQDDGLRMELRTRLARERVLAVLCDGALGAHFRAAVEWMRATGPRQSGAPVYIEAGCAPRVMNDWPLR